MFLSDTGESEQKEDRNVPGQEDSIIKGAESS